MGNPRTWARALATAAVCAAVQLGVITARADRSYPDRVEKRFGLGCDVPCTLCHLDMNGGFGSFRVTSEGKPGVGQTYHEKFGLQGTADGKSFDPAFDAATLAKSDVDRDGIVDSVEIAQGSDPNDADPDARLCGDLPQYGCGARVAPGDDVDDVAIVFAATALLASAAALRRRVVRAR